MSDKRKLIIDTDCGSDDAMAIAMALRDEDYEILMFSAVSGNVRVKQAAYNVLTTIKLAGTYAPPVYIGSDEMLKRDFVGAYDTHGLDGMGDLNLVDYSREADEGDGVDMIIKTLKDHEDKSIDLITLGPLTNIAKAVMKDPETMRRIRRVVSMAGADGVGGNVTEHAEFNIWQDAEAFKIVLDFGFEDIVFVTWDASLGDCVLEEEDIERIRNLSPLGRFCIDSNVTLLQLNQRRFHRDILDMADPAAVCAALYPDSIVSCELCHLDVNLDEGEYYGHLSIDRTGNSLPNAGLCTKLNADLYKQYVLDHLK